MTQFQSFSRLLLQAIKTTPAEGALTAPSRFPVVVRGDTRAFLDTQAAALNSSIASLAGIILDGVAAASVTATGPLSTLSVAQRVFELLTVYGLSAAGAENLLRPHGITLSMLANTEDLAQELTAERLTGIAEVFRVDYRWLTGKIRESQTETPIVWYKQPMVALCAIAEAAMLNNVELLLYREEKSNLDKLDDDSSKGVVIVPILVRTQPLPGGEELKTYQLMPAGDWEYAPCRYDLKRLIHFLVQLRDSGDIEIPHLRSDQLNIKGRALPAAAFDRLQRFDGLIPEILSSTSKDHWIPEDYASSGFATSRQPQEWEFINSVESIKMHQDFFEFCREFKKRHPQT